MAIPRSLLLIPLLIVFVLVAGCMQNSPPEPAATSSISTIQTMPLAASPVTPGMSSVPGTNLTTRGVIAFVDRAVAYARENGKERGIAAFNDPNGPFVTSHLYVFAGSYDGTSLAEPFQHELVGTNILGLTDPFGVPIVQNNGETARFGKGYVSYEYPNPWRNFTVEPKLSIVEDVDGTYYIGAGIYASDSDTFPSVTLNASLERLSVNDLVTYVKSAAVYARKNGKETALPVFNNPAGPFAQGELVIMAFDYNGTNLASPPYSPELREHHINLINYHDPDGVATIRGMRDLAQEGGGFLYTVAKVKVNGTGVYVPKIDYAEPIDKDWWIFSGIIDPSFPPEVLGNLTGIRVRNHSRMELYGLVNRAVTFAKANGREKTLSVINDPAGEFVDGDLFVWAESINGTVLADPYWKSLIGENFIDYTDEYGLKTTRAGISAMQNSTGFSRTLFPDASGHATATVPKLVYMKAVDDTWWIGSGVYGVAVGPETGREGLGRTR